LFLCCSDFLMAKGWLLTNSRRAAHIKNCETLSTWSSCLPYRKASSSSRKLSSQSASRGKWTCPLRFAPAASAAPSTIPASPFFIGGNAGRSPAPATSALPHLPLPHLPLRPPSQASPFFIGGNMRAGREFRPETGSRTTVSSATQSGLRGVISRWGRIAVIPAG
jgi:hypothetical protein